MIVLHIAQIAPPLTPSLPSVTDEVMLGATRVIQFLVSSGIIIMCWKAAVFFQTAVGAQRELTEKVSEAKKSFDRFAEEVRASLVDHTIKLTEVRGENDALSKRIDTLETLERRHWKRRSDDRHDDL